MSWRLSLLPMNTQGLEMLRAPHEQRQPVARRASRYNDISLVLTSSDPIISRELNLVRPSSD